ncbi:MAG: phosphatidylserine decarboxylase family protein [Chitinophagales bacterium]|nr:phosphatidylserine decarboxylase family protein [Chitinophagales bacterium]
MKIHKEGYKIILVSLLSISLLLFFLYRFYPDNHYLLPFSIFSLAMFLFIVSFFRNPKRFTPDGDDYIICPADGKVVVIEEVYEREYFKDKRLQVSVFMSPANVHVNRSPIGGEVKYFKYHPGKYLVAWHPKSSTDNESTSMVIENDSFEIMVRQIAGKLARRIVYYVEEGDELEKGMEFGFIKFGSRIDLYLPLETKISVKIGDKVRGGETIIGVLQDIDE